MIPTQKHSLLANTLKTAASSVALPALEKTQDYIAAISIGGQPRVPGQVMGASRNMP
jgi:hypothetical protein